MQSAPATTATGSLLFAAEALAIAAVVAVTAVADCAAAGSVAAMAHNGLHVTLSCTL
jgi:hypothetical protein